MTMQVADVGAAQILNAYFKNTWPAGGKDLTLFLFATNVTPDDTKVLGDFTEAAGGGYAAKTLANGAGWTISKVGNIEQAAFAAQTFTFTGALTTNGTVYGYGVKDADGVLITAELLPAPFTPASNGDNVVVTPIFQLSKGTPT